MNIIKILKLLLLSSFIFLDFTSFGMEFKGVRNKDSVLVQNTRQIIDYCNNSDSLSLIKFLRIEKINNKVADNSIFLNLVFSFNVLGEKNKIISDTFFEKSTEYCYRFFGENFVLVVGKDAQVFEFNNEGYLVGFYLCLSPSKH